MSTGCIDGGFKVSRPTSFALGVGIVNEENAGESGHCRPVDFARHCGMMIPENQNPHGADH